jgi:DNA-binding ferritin-like protein
MKAPYLIALFSLLLLPSCGQDAASKEAEARVVASIQQTLGTTNTSYVNQVHTWYQSDVPNLIKLHPKTETIYQTHAAILQEVATQEPKLTANKILTPEQAEGIRAKYKQLSEESAARVQELSALATSTTTMSEADQLKYVSDLADKQTRHLALVRYYTKRTGNTIAQKERQATTKRLMMQEFGHY